MKYLKSLMLIAGAIIFAAHLNAEVKKIPNGEDVPAVMKKAKWMWQTNPDFDLHNLYVLFRRSVKLERVPQDAKVCITADQSYRLYINGVYVASGPARGFQASWPYDVIDVSKYLKTGKNTIAIRAFTPNRSSFSYRTEGMAGVLFAAQFDGQTILSDGKWKARRQDGLNRDTMPYSLQISGHQEMIDLALEPTNWMDENFDDSAWTNSNAGPVFNSMPYYNLEPRGTDMLDENLILSAKLVGESAGAAKNSDKYVRSISLLLMDEELKHNAVANGEAYAVAAPSKTGEFKSFVFDFGKFSIGMPILEIKGAKGGEIVDMQYVEVLEEGLKPLILGKTHSKTGLANRLICKAGDFSYQFYHIMGFRYALIRVRNNHDSTLTITPKLRWTAYPLDGAENFKCSDPYLMQIWEACRQGQRVCAMDSYVDTPMREQAMWWGDARVQSWNTFMLKNDPRLLKRGIRIMTGQKTPGGLLYGHAPTMAHTCILPDFNLIWMCTLWDYYWQTGDVSAFVESKDTADGILSYFDEWTDKDTGLVKFDDRYWLFLDWTNVQKNGRPAILNLWLLYALQKLEALAQASNMPDAAKAYAARATALKAAIEKNLILPSGLIADGLSVNGKQNETPSIHAQVLGKLCGVKFDFEKAKRDMILPYLNGKELPNDPSAYWSVYVLMLMNDEGYAEDCLNFIKLRWKDMAEYGCTFESFKPHTGESHSHAWTAHPLFLIPQILFGYKQEAPAWKKISVRPTPFKLDFADLTIPSPQGDIKFVMKKGANGVDRVNCIATGVEVIEKPAK